VACIKVGMFYEFLGLKRNKEKDKRIPWLRTLNWCFFFWVSACAFFLALLGLKLTKDKSKYIPCFCSLFFWVVACVVLVTYCNTRQLDSKSIRWVCTGWRRLIGSHKLQIIFHKRAFKYRSLLRKMTYKDKGSYESSPPCILNLSFSSRLD